MYGGHYLVIECSLIGRVIVAKDAEEDQFSDLLTLMEMLTNLLSKDFIDFGVSGKMHIIIGHNNKMISFFLQILTQGLSVSETSLWYLDRPFLL